MKPEQVHLKLISAIKENIEVLKKTDIDDKNEQLGASYDNIALHHMAIFRRNCLKVWRYIMALIARIKGTYYGFKDRNQGE